jgi:type 1 glutamine amidotransferase
MICLRSWISVTAMLVAFLPVSAQRTVIVLVGGVKSHAAGEHDFPAGVCSLQAILNSSPDVKRRSNISVEAYPNGWPEDDAVLKRAATIVWYFDGLQGHPLLNEKRRTQFRQLMREGVGLVALHQASTLPPNDTSVDLTHWLGAARYGMFDRTEETVQLVPAKHPVTRGVSPFTYHDEFYPTLRFSPDSSRITPILAPALHIAFREGKDIHSDQTSVYTVAWAFDRADGGRSFGYTGLHYLAGLDQPDLRKLLLNAIFWTAHVEVPKGGVRSTNAPPGGVPCSAPGGGRSAR